MTSKPQSMTGFGKHESQNENESQNGNENENLIWMDCWFDVPDDLPAELEVECGQWRTKANSQPSDEKPRLQTEFNLMFVVLRDNSADHQKDPLFYLSGGPGSSTYLEKENVDSWFYWFEIAKLSRDIILVDQRGTGLSRPKFECDNYASFVRDALKENLPVKEEYIKAYGTVDACLKKAKKKGFNEGCKSKWILLKTKKKYYTNTELATKANKSQIILRPTQSLLQKWLREEHKIYLSITACKDNRDED